MYVNWEVPLSISDIKKMQLNRYPLLFLDAVIALEPGSYATAKKNFSYNEWFFPAHFEDDPSVPGFVQIEALAQTFLTTFLTLPNMAGKQTSFVSISNAKFQRKIVPGDTLMISATLTSFRRGIATGSVSSSVEDELACSADLVIAVPEILDKFRPHSR